MAFTVLQIETIVSDSNIRNGRPTIAGTGIPVADIALAHLTGDKLPPEQLAQNYRLTLGEVHAALSYYYQHQQAIDDQTTRDAEQAKQLLQVLDAQGKLIRID